MNNRVYINDAVNKYLSHLRRKKPAKKVIEDYKFILENLYDYFTASQPTLDNISTEDIALYFNYLQGCQYKFNPFHRERTSLELEPARFKQAKEEIYTFWEWAAKKYNLSNPIIPKTLADDSKRIPPVSDDSVRQFIKFLVGNNQNIGNKKVKVGKSELQAIALVLLLVDTGIRAEELTRLLVKDVNFKEKIIEIHNVNNFARKIQLGNELTRILLQYILSNYPEATPENALLFTKDDLGTPLDRVSLHLFISDLGNKAGVGNLYALRFRASFAKLCEEVCLYEESVMENLGLYDKQHLQLYIDEWEYKGSTREDFRKASPADKWDL